ncbi:hypothetical protein FJT64_024618 [Amphibalanus amphitrite]|uniref:Uncharacterized protein n=1 Tax=Amphibalanus amphitrite TaxID=1232801 RepID=A0A6A4WN42_AMPAM|nr:hypothetical protein FJT64_024618 [Amphibalanus amphitrite]
MAGLDPSERGDRPRAGPWRILQTATRYTTTQELTSRYPKKISARVVEKVVGRLLVSCSVSSGVSVSTRLTAASSDDHLSAGDSSVAWVAHVRQ